MKLQVSIRRKNGLADPEGTTAARALRDLGYTEIGEVRFGRAITVEMDTDDPQTALARVGEMCERLLANPVIEDYDVEVVT